MCLCDFLRIKTIVVIEGKIRFENKGMKSFGFMNIAVWVQITEFPMIMTDGLSVDFAKSAKRLGFESLWSRGVNETPCS